VLDSSVLNRQERVSQLISCDLVNIV